jgi:putative membrane protein
MWQFLVRLAINALAIWVAAELFIGIELTENPLGIAVVALVFGLVNALLRPIAMFLGFPFIILTLGLFALVINSALFGLTAWLTPALEVDGFWPAFWGALVVSLVSWILGNVLGVREKKRTKAALT